MEPTIEAMREAAFKNLHLIYILKNGNGTYRIVKSEAEGTPVLVEYISFHFKTSMIRVKDIGSNFIYLLNPIQFKNSWVKDLLKKDKTLEQKIRGWYPFLWGEGAKDEAEKYRSIIRQLKEYADLEKPLEVPH